ncbi:MAG TPA: c-type cytochrome biogenesis protein CcmI [Xanthobacteraceae bacterium]|nr:c-type cytochrome biogenesis protein CcmI [Xanthobacteraceae bacterium]
MLWLIFAVMTAAAVGAVWCPLARKGKGRTGGSDRLVYQDQLLEIERDRAAGLIGGAEAESARVEISRRLLAAADAEHSAAAPPPAERFAFMHRAAAIACAVILPAVGLGFYLWLGAPEIPSQSAFARVDTPLGERSIASLVVQVEAHLASNPNDGAGWEVIAPVYMRLGRFSDAAAAWRKTIALNGDNATRESALGEALVASANGIVTDEALSTFQHAVAADPHEPKASYFLGLADEQAGKRDAAIAKWRALLDSTPQDAPWKEFVRNALARVNAAPASATADAGDAAAGAGDGQRAEMIQGMVQRLADRLHTSGGNVDEWLRLVQAYIVLGDRDKAKGAVTDAKRALSDHPDEIRRIDDLVKGLGLNG